MNLRILRHNGAPTAAPMAAVTGQQAPQAQSRCAACLVRHLAVCAALPLAQARGMESMASDVVLAAGELLVHEGETRRGVFMVTAGSLRRIRLLSDGRRVVSGFLMPGDFIGFSAASHYRHSIEAITESRLCTFALKDMRTLCVEHPQLERELLERACVELDATRDNLMALARMKPVERLAGFLLDMAARRRRQGQSGDEVLLPMSRADIADYLGLTVETVSRSFTRLRQDGVIAAQDAHHISLIDSARLHRLAEARD